MAAHFGSGEYLETGWDDQRFYEATDATLLTGLRALLWPTPSVLHVDLHRSWAERSMRPAVTWSGRRRASDWVEAQSAEGHGQQAFK